MPAAVNFGIQYRILYNGYWSFGPAAVSYGQSTNMLVDNNQPQRIWSYELYPRGREVWKSWGYWSPGYYNTWFYGDEAGWHQVAVYGDASGWSNPVWVYVARSYYPSGPTWPPSRPGNTPPYPYPYDDGYPGDPGYPGYSGSPGYPITTNIGSITR